MKLRLRWAIIFGLAGFIVAGGITVGVVFVHRPSATYFLPLPASGPRPLPGPCWGVPGLLKQPCHPTGSEIAYGGMGSSLVSSA